jgi:hypothetical protein
LLLAPLPLLTVRRLSPANDVGLHTTDWVKPAGRTTALAADGESTVTRLVTPPRATRQAAPAAGQLRNLAV